MEQGWTSKQPDATAIFPGHLYVGPSALAVERLMHFVTALEQDVVIEIRPRVGAKGAGRVKVVGAARVRGLVRRLEPIHAQSA